jgi:hypothetical protein
MKGSVCRLLNKGNISTHVINQRDFLREILLSYRLLFGQDQRSRKLFRDRERSSISGSGHFDPFLDDLCGRKAANLQPRIAELLPEQRIYSIETRFPVLGGRLLELQAYNMRQNPGKLKELWRDRRNPLQFFTFWAVIVIGGLSILLSFLQILLSAAQLAVSLRQSQCTC